MTDDDKEKFSRLYLQARGWIRVPGADRWFTPLRRGEDFSFAGALEQQSGADEIALMYTLENGDSVIAATLLHMVIREFAKMTEGKDFMAGLAKTATEALSKPGAAKALFAWLDQFKAAWADVRKATEADQKTPN